MAGKRLTTSMVGVPVKRAAANAAPVRRTQSWWIGDRVGVARMTRPTTGVCPVHGVVVRAQHEHTETAVVGRRHDLHHLGAAGSDDLVAFGTSRTVAPSTTSTRPKSG
jgi:hypothetical protein